MNAATYALVVREKITDRPFVLLGYRSFNPGKHLWSFPGGRIERSDLNELKAARREFMEETKIHRVKEKLIGQHTINFFFFKVLTFVHECTVSKKLTDELKSYSDRGSHEFIELRFFPVDELPRNVNIGTVDALKRFYKTLSLGTDIVPGPAPKTIQVPSKTYSRDSEGRLHVHGGYTRKVKPAQSKPSYSIPIPEKQVALQKYPPMSSELEKKMNERWAAYVEREMHSFVKRTYRDFSGTQAARN